MAQPDQRRRSLARIPSMIWRSIADRPNLAKIVHNIGWLVAGRLSQLSVGVIVTVWIARYLGPAQFGVIGFALALVGLASSLGNLGLNSIVVRDVLRDPDRAHVTLGTAAALQVLSGTVTFAFLVGLACFLRPDDRVARLVMIIVALPVILKPSVIAKSWFESQVESKYAVWVDNGVFLLISAAKIALILTGAPLLDFAWAYAAQTGLAAIGMIVMFGRRGVPLHRLRAVAGRAGALLRDSWPLIVSGVAVAAYMRIDMVMLGQMLGDRAVGIYGAATRISEVWYFVPMAIAGSVFPAILGAKETSEELYYRRLQQLCDLMVVIAIAVAIPMTFFSDWVVSVLFGRAYAQAGPVLAVHVWAALFVFLGIASGRWVVAENRQMLSLQRTTAGAVVNIVLNYLFIPKYGVIAAAWATVASYAVAGFLFDALQRETWPIFVMKLRSFNVFAYSRYVRSVRF